MVGSFCPSQPTRVQGTKKSLRRCRDKVRANVTFRGIVCIRMQELCYRHNLLTCAFPLYLLSWPRAHMNPYQIHLTDSLVLQPVMISNLKLALKRKSSIRRQTFMNYIPHHRHKTAITGPHRNKINKTCLHVKSVVQKKGI